MSDLASNRTYVARIAEYEGGYRSIVMCGDQLVYYSEITPDPQEAKRRAALFVICQPEEQRTLAWGETITNPNLMRCERHGLLVSQSHTCQHLPSAERLGYFALQVPVPPFHAWCEACEAVRREERGWSRRCEEQAGSVRGCTWCYKELLARHVFRGWDED